MVHTGSAIWPDLTPSSPTRHLLFTYSSPRGRNPRIPYDEWRKLFRWSVRDGNLERQEQVDERPRSVSSRLSATEVGVVVGLIAGFLLDALFVGVLLGAALGVAVDWWAECRDSGSPRR
jgi:hypothetical protein